jgi:hypothetical protein
MASTSAQTDKKSDPIVLGVSVPLNVTLSAVKQVADAWQKFGMDFAQAVTHMRDNKATQSKSAKEAAGESSASAAAGVSA